MYQDENRFKSEWLDGMPLGLPSYGSHWRWNWLREKIKEMITNGKVLRIDCPDPREANRCTAVIYSAATKRLLPPNRTLTCTKIPVDSNFPEGRQFVFVRLIPTDPTTP